MEACEIAKKVFAEIHERKPEITTAYIGVVMDPETGTHYEPMVMETNVDVAKKRVGEFDRAGADAKLREDCEFCNYWHSVEGTLWEVGTKAFNDETIVARILSIIVME